MNRLGLIIFKKTKFDYKHHIRTITVIPDNSSVHEVEFGALHFSHVDIMSAQIQNI